MYNPDETRRNASSHLVVAVDIFDVQIGDLDVVSINNKLSVKLHFTVAENPAGVFNLLCLYLFHVFGFHNVFFALTTVKKI